MPAGGPHLDVITILGPYNVAHDGAKPVAKLGMTWRRSKR